MILRVIQLETISFYAYCQMTLVYIYHFSLDDDSAKPRKREMKREACLEYCDTLSIVLHSRRSSITSRLHRQFQVYTAAESRLPRTGRDPPPPLGNSTVSGICIWLGNKTRRDFFRTTKELHARAIPACRWVP